jgi:hypothetical protein
LRVVPSPSDLAADGNTPGEDAEAWAGADELAVRHAVSRRTIFRWLAAGQVVSRELEGVTQYRVVGAHAPAKGPRAPTPPPPAVGPTSPGGPSEMSEGVQSVEDSKNVERSDASTAPGAESSGHAAAVALPALDAEVAEVTDRLERLERKLEAGVAPKPPDARTLSRELEQARLLTELATRHAEQSRKDLDETKKLLADTRRALEIERERAYRLALVATLPWWQFRVRREMLAEIAAMKALPMPKDDDVDE